MKHIIEFFYQLADDHNYWGILAVLSGPILLVAVFIIVGIAENRKENRRQKKEPIDRDVKNEN